MIEVKKTETTKNNNVAYNPTKLPIDKELTLTIGYICVNRKLCDYIDYNGISYIPYNHMIHVITAAGSTTYSSKNTVDIDDFYDIDKMKSFNSFIVFTNAMEAKEYYLNFYDACSDAGLEYDDICIIVPVILENEFIADITESIDECILGSAYVTAKITVTKLSIDKDEEDKEMNKTDYIEGYIVTNEEGKFPYEDITITFDAYNSKNAYEFPTRNARYDKIVWIGSFLDPACKSGFAVFTDIVDAHRYYYNKLASINGTRFKMFKVISDSYIDVTKEVYDEAYNVTPYGKIYNCSKIDVVSEININEILSAYKKCNQEYFTSEDLDAALSINAETYLELSDLLYDNDALVSVISEAAERCTLGERKMLMLYLLRIVDKYLADASNFKDKEFNEEFLKAFYSLKESYQNGLMKNFHRVDEPFTK